MARSAIRECHRLTEEMMLGWLPAVNLDTIVDNLANSQVGYSYLSELSLVITLGCDITIFTLPKNRLHHNVSRPYKK
jgi:arginine utilization protein RocB